MARTVENAKRAKRSKGKRPAALPAGLAAPELEDFLGPELGGAFDAHGEPVSLNARDLVVDRELRQLAWRLWQEQQRRHGKAPRRRLADADLEPSDLWQPGVTETLQTCSTEDELKRYRLKLRFRADLLEALLEETLADLERANALKHPMDASGDSDSSAGGRSRDQRKGA